jgi:light-harvesting complex I chlorophyll a/b binding protein 5
MVAVIGFFVQALVTRDGALDNLSSHLASPFENNIVGSIANIPNVIGK